MAFVLKTTRTAFDLVPPVEVAPHVAIYGVLVTMEEHEMPVGALHGEYAGDHFRLVRQGGEWEVQPASVELPALLLAKVNSLALDALRVLGSEASNG